MVGRDANGSREIQLNPGVWQRLVAGLEKDIFCFPS